MVCRDKGERGVGGKVCVGAVGAEGGDGAESVSADGGEAGEVGWGGLQSALFSPHPLFARKVACKGGMVFSHAIVL